MTDKPARIVDAHVHLWDPGPHRLVPVPVGSPAARTWATCPGCRAASTCRPTWPSRPGGTSRSWSTSPPPPAATRSTRRSSSTGAPTSRRPPRRHRRRPAARPTRWPRPSSCIERQMAASRFRGVRPMGAFDGPLPSDDVLRALHERGLVFELMAHPDQLAGGGRGLDRRRRAGRRRRAHRVAAVGVGRGVRACGRPAWTRWPGLGDNVVCKLSGLAMPLGSMRRRCVRPVDRARHRGVRRRPVHVRQQLPGRRHARHVRRAVLDVRTRSPPGSTTPPATSSSPPPPSASTAAERIVGLRRRRER